jgi:hypothetical protein
MPPRRAAVVPIAADAPAPDVVQPPDPPRDPPPAQTAERTRLSESEVRATEAFTILAQFTTPKGICISVLGEYWENMPHLHGTRYTGEIVQWGRKNEVLRVHWEDTDDSEHLDALLHPEVEFRFEPYKNSNPAPRLTGRAAARHEREQDDENEPETVDIEYDEGSERKVQTWKVERPDGITLPSTSGPRRGRRRRSTAPLSAPRRR